MDGVRITQTNKGKEALLVDSFTYRLDRESGIAKTWRCSIRGCPARCKTRKDNTNAVFSNDHTHEAKTQREVAVGEFRKLCRKRGADDLFERPAKVMRRELSNEAAPDIHIKEMENVRKAIYNERRKFIPKLPKNRQETHQCVEQFGLTSSEGENMLLKNNVESGLIIFSTLSNLGLLCRQDVQILGDGTFKTCPRFFLQIYVLHAYKDGVYVPCVFCLLSSKTEHMYRDMFMSLRDLCSDNELDLQMASINLDFERACHAAVKAVWPGVSIKGCHFHLSQSWYRKISSLGLSDEYKAVDSEIGRWLKRFFGLSFVAPQDVADSMAFDIMNDSPDDPRCVDFSDYIIGTYVEAGAPFPPPVWADSEINGVRTTNGCESFHRHFGDQFYHAHPNIFELMQKIKEVQTVTYVKMNSINSAHGLLHTRPQRRRKLQEMMRLQQRYNRGEISRQDYVQAMAWKNLPAII